jgi:hypothetical protein
MLYIRTCFTEMRLTTIRPLKSVKKIEIPWTIKVKSDKLETRNPSYSDVKMANYMYSMYNHFI